MALQGAHLNSDYWSEKLLKLKNCVNIMCDHVEWHNSV
jgi:hypothetical protein